MQIPKLDLTVLKTLEMEELDNEIHEIRLKQCTKLQEHHEIHVINTKLRRKPYF